MEFIVELLLEFLLQAVGELLFEMGLRALVDPFRHKPSPWLAAIGYLLFGAALGAASLWLVPEHMVRSEPMRWVNLAITPWAVGAGMALVGRLRERRGDLLLRIDHFAYGYLFALSVALVRFIWAH